MSAWIAFAFPSTHLSLAQVQDTPALFVKSDLMEQSYLWLKSDNSYELFLDGDVFTGLIDSGSYTYRDGTILLASSNKYRNLISGQFQVYVWGKEALSLLEVFRERVDALLNEDDSLIDFSVERVCQLVSFTVTVGGRTETKPLVSFVGDSEAISRNELEVLRSAVVEYLKADNKQKLITYRPVRVGGRMVLARPDALSSIERAPHAHMRMLLSSDWAGVYVRAAQGEMDSYTTLFQRSRNQPSKIKKADVDGSE